MHLCYSYPLHQLSGRSPPAHLPSYMHHALSLLASEKDQSHYAHYLKEHNYHAASILVTHHVMQFKRWSENFSFWAILSLESSLYTVMFPGSQPSEQNNSLLSQVRAGNEAKSDVGSAERVSLVLEWCIVSLFGKWHDLQYYWYSRNLPPNIHASCSLSSGIWERPTTLRHLIKHD